MTSLSPIAYLTDPLTTEANFQTGIGNLQGFVQQLLGGSSAGALTIAAGSVTPSVGFNIIDGTGSSTNLTNLLGTNLPDGSIIAITSTNAARAIVVKQAATGSGQVYLNGSVDATLDNPSKVLFLRRSTTGDCWYEVIRNWGVGAFQSSDLASTWNTLGINSFWCGTSTNSGNAYSVTTTPGATALTVGMTIRFIVNAPNGGASTVNVDGFGYKPLTKNGATALSPNDMALNAVVTATYDGTQFQIISGPSVSLGSVASATTTDLGAVGSPVVQVTGSALISSFGTSAIAGEEITAIFAAGITLVNSSTLILPGSVNITTQANDVGRFARTSSGWICTSYQTASGAPLSGSSSVEVPVRQCVLAGDVDANNKANFLTVGTGLTPAYTVNSGQLLLAYANGFGANGAVDLVTRLTAAGSLSAVTANATNYLYATYASSSSVTWGSTLMPVQYGQVFDPQGYGLFHMENSGADDYGNPAAINTNGSYSAAQAKFGSYSWLSGSSSYLTLVAVNVGSPWTVEGWVYLPALGVAQYMVSCSGGGYGISWQLSASNKSVLYAAAQGASSWNVASGVAGSQTWLAGWNKVTLTWDGAALRATVNGVLDVYAASSTPIIISGQLRLNWYTTGSAGPGNSGVYYDEFRISPCCRYATAATVPGTAVFTPEIAPLSPDGDFFNIAAMQMNSITGPGPVFTPVQRVYVGECVAGAASITSVISYALQRKYTTAWATGLPSAGTAVSVAHNLGCSLHKVRAEIKNLTENTGSTTNTLGVTIPWQTNSSGALEPMSDALNRSRNTDVGYTGNNNSAVYQVAGGSIAGATPANWAYRFIFEGF